MPLVSGSKRHLLWLTLLFGAWYVLPLGSRTLWDPDEGRYAEIAREMVEQQEWVTPHLNYLKYFEKPPLMYWLTALSLKVFGEREVAARLWCALFGVGGVLLTYGLGTLLGGAALGWPAAIILGTALGYVGFSQYLTLDMALTFLTTLALFCLTLERTRPQYRGLALVGMSVAVGCAVLTKGLIGIFPFGVALVTWLLDRERLPFQPFRWGVRLLIAAAVAAPWFVLVSLRNPEFPRFFFLHEHLQRFLTHGHERPGSLLYYVPVVLLGFFPWSCCFPIRGLHQSPRWRGFPLVWAGVILGFFSLSRSKLPGYVLPAFPALALLIGERWRRQMETRQPVSRGALGLVVIAFMGLAGGVAWVAVGGRSLGEVPAASSGLWLIAGIAFAAGIGLLILGHQGSAHRTFYGLVGASLAITFGCYPALRSADPHQSNKALVQAIGPRLRPETHLVSYGINYERRLQSLAFYAKRPVLMIGGPWEFELGARMASIPAVFPDTPGSLSQLFSAHEDLIGVTKIEPWADLQRGFPLPLVELARSSDKVAFTRRR
ncbi:MAG: glycosyltransferase family 39 protein [Elusimicrobia bacterium]|nr:glycosyltransferase family 39 protein [Elusimicrobiota bacterium]